MRISDWSSDVCSSDLNAAALFRSSRSPYANSLGSLRRSLPRRRGRRPRSNWNRRNKRGRIFRAPHPQYDPSCQTDRKSVVEGKSVSVRVDLGGRRIIKKKKTKTYTNQTNQKNK